jgi:hypothetical protein
MRLLVQIIKYYRLFVWTVEVEGIAGVASYLGAQKQLGLPRLDLSLKGQTYIRSFNLRASETNIRCYFLVAQEYWQCMATRQYLFAVCPYAQNNKNFTDIPPYFGQHSNTQLRSSTDRSPVIHKFYTYCEASLCSVWFSF